MKFNDNDNWDWHKCKLLAEAFGWSHLKESGRLDGQVVGYPPVDPTIGQREEVPNYFGDLNVIHEAIKNLDDEQYAEYRWWLWRVAAPVEPGTPINPSTRSRRYHEATAEQKAIAVGLTLKLWTI